MDSQEGECAEELPDEPLLAPPAAAARAALLLVRSAKIHARRGACPGLAVGRYGCCSALCLQVCFPVVATLLVTLLPRALIKALVADSDSVFQEEVQPPTFHNPWPGLPLRMDGDARRLSEEVRLSPHFARYKQFGQPPMLGLHAVEGAQGLHDLLFAQTRLPWQCHCKTLAITGHRGSAEAFKQYVQRQYAAWEAAAQSRGLTDPVNATGTVLLDTKVSEGESAWLGCDVDAGHAGPLFRLFPSSSAVDAWIDDPKYGAYARDRTEASPIDRLCGAVVFENDAVLEPEPRYTIRTNITASGKTFGYKDNSRYGDLVDLSQFLTRPGADFLPDHRRDDAGSFMWYQYSGFLSLQHLAHGFLAERAGSTPTRDILQGEPRFMPMPLGEARFRKYQEALASFATHPLLLALQFSPGVAMLAYHLCRERSAHRHQLLRALGCSRASSILSWLVLFLLLNLAASLPCAIVVRQTCLWRSSPSVLFLAYYLFACGIGTMGLTAAALAPNERVGVVAALGFVLFSSFAGISPFDAPSSKLCASLLPTTAFQMILDVLLLLEGSGGGCTWATLSRRVGNFSVAWGLGMLLLDLPLWLCLYCCLDYLVPWGARRGAQERWRVRGLPCSGACCRRGRRQPPASPGGGAEPLPGLFEPEDERRLQEMLEKDRCVVASGLTKEFEGLGGVKVRAVDGLSLRMFDSECACLLGHNGAGKTTALSLLVGELTPTRGSVRILGSDLHQDLQHASVASGFCPQQTVLFDELTVAEHLALVRHLRVAPSAAAAAAEVGDECFLDVQTGKHAGCLSSSARRKLTVAMALVGRPKFVVLDEPSDGMDPTSRCGLWRALQTRRRNCILCVSTHSMMEAEALGDRIAVMSEGRLVCGGSHAFLTRTHRCSYALSFVRRGALPDAAILELVREHCGPLAEISSALGKELLVQVPFEEAASLPKLFGVLDKRRDFLGIETYSVSMTSFEAVFAKLGHSAAAMEQALKRPATLLRPSRSRPVFQSQGSWVPPLQTELPERTDSPTWHIHVHGDVGETPRPDTSLGASPAGSPLGSWTPRTSCSPRTPRDEAGLPMTSGWAARNSLEPPDERTPGGHARASSRTPRGFTPGRAPRTPREGETPRGGRGLLPLGTPREEPPRGTFTPGRAPRTPRDLAGEGTPTSRGRPAWTPRGGTPRGGTPRATTPRESAQKAQDANSDVGQRKVRKAKPSGFLSQLLVLGRRRVKCGVRDPKTLGLRLLLPSLCPVVFACLASHHDAAPPPKVLDTSSWNAGVEGSRVPVTVAVEEASGAQFASAATEAWMNWTPPGVDDVHFSRALNASDASFTSLDPEVLGLASDQLPQLRAEKAFVDLLLSRRSSLAASHYGAVLYPRERYARQSRHTTSQQGLNRNGTCGVTTHMGEGSILKECLAATSASSVGPTIFANLSAYHAAPTLFNIHASALLRAHTRGSLRRVEVVNHPFQRTAHEASGADGTDGLILALALVLVWSFLPASVASHTVMEREAGVKHQLLVSGSSQAAYWLSNLIFDYLLVLASTAIMFLVLIVCRQDVGGLLEVPGVMGLTVMSMLYGFTATSSSYLLFAPLFSKPGAAAWGTFVANVALGSSATITVFVLQSGGTSTLDYAAEVTASFFRLVPSCALGIGALLIGRNHRLAKHVGISAFSGWWTGGMHCPTASAYTWDCTYMVGDEVWMLALQALMFSGLTVVLGCASELRAWRRFRVQGARKLPLAQAEDADVAAETQRVAGLNPRTEIVCVNGVSKVFGGGCHAVRGVSFASAEGGEVFGVLGPNGAGKTTLLRLLCGELLPSAGRLHLRGLDVVDCVSDVRRLLGYCPQRDPLLDSLTVQEHLALHSGLRGASECGPESEVQRHLSQFGLSSFSRWRAGQLSSGNKRKLSVALACVAEPPLLFLDEPSAGMDPVARRGLWAALHGAAEMRRRSVVLLATHSPEEAESLCSRIAIQAEGSFRRLGSAQRMRSSHKQGLEMSVHVVLPTAKDVEAHFQGEQDFDDAARVSAEALLLRSRRERLEALLARELGPEAGGKEKGFRLLEASGNLLRYEILQEAAEGDAKPFSEVFRVLEENRDDLMLEDLHLSHGSLAQAFESALAADGKTQAGSQSAAGATAARGAGREKFVAVDMSTRVMSDSAFSDSDIGEMTAELDTAAAECEPRSQSRALI